MNRVRMILNVLSLTFLFCLLFARPAHAYLDMGTGSYLLQVAIASFLGGVVMVKIYWKKIKEYLASIFSPKKGPPDNEA